MHERTALKSDDKEELSPRGKTSPKPKVLAEAEFSHCRTKKRLPLHGPGHACRPCTPLKAVRFEGVLLPSPNNTLPQKVELRPLWCY